MDRRYFSKCASKYNNKSCIKNILQYAVFYSCRKNICFIDVRNMKPNLKWFVPRGFQSFVMQPTHPYDEWKTFDWIRKMLANNNFYIQSNMNIEIKDHIGHTCQGSKSCNLGGCKKASFELKWNINLILISFYQTASHLLLHYIDVSILDTQL